MKLVVLGLSITSSWGNGHATTYRALLREWHSLGHEAVFLERNTPWYEQHRDSLDFPFCKIELYKDTGDLRRRFEGLIRSADAVIVGSYVPDGTAVGEWVNSTAEGVTAFYDIDTPVTLTAIDRGECEYLTAALIAKYKIYFSFTGGPTLSRLEKEYSSPAARALYCSVDTQFYYPEVSKKRWLMGYLGTYSADRQISLHELLILPALLLPGERFALAGPQYPKGMQWPPNLQRIDHVPPDAHRKFYSEQQFTLNVTRADMRRFGYSPSIRLFEAAACGIPIISDRWEGIETFFNPGEEILLAQDTREIMSLLRDLPEKERHAVGTRARNRVLQDHTARRRAEDLVSSLQEASHDLKLTGE
jgi:spore maturation protein CgeB